MSRGEVRIRVVGVLREEPDLRLLARALIGLARSEAAAGGPETKRARPRPAGPSPSTAEGSRPDRDAA